MKTVTEALVARLAEKQVHFIFGVPGGECNLDFIAAADKLGLRFILTRTETSAAIMACVASELTGSPGVVMTTRGPGLAAAANGVAYADLDRVPLLIIADGYEDSQASISHQRIDQTAILAPMTRASSSLRDSDPLAELDRLLVAAHAQPPGPVYLEVAGSYIRGPVPPSTPGQAPAISSNMDAGALAAAIDVVAKARKPILIAGLQARAPAAVDALRGFVDATGCPVLSTYKAKGVASEHERLTLGLYAGGIAEEAIIRSSDLIILYGFDPVEGPPQPWRYADIATLELTEHMFELPLVTPTVSVAGSIAASLSALQSSVAEPKWTAEELSVARDHLWSAARISKGAGISPAQLVDAARAALPADTRITIDAGAHMLPVLHLFQCTEPNQSLISRGLSTMGFAVPAAIAASLVDPGRTTVAFTGDGGIMMCLGELGTAIQSGCRPIIVVFNDSSLTLIGAKQKRRDLAAAGVDFSDTDFAQVAGGFGWLGLRIEKETDLPAAFASALASPKPTLIDVVINPESYDAQIRAIRG
jgi:acetolactate synthase-1/2/3 large subunit